MLIGLVDVDSHAKKNKWGAKAYPNLALCKISAYHKAKGDVVEWATPLFQHYDIVYKSKIFNFSKEDDFVYDADEIIKGGTGYDIHSKLPPEIDDMQPDYSIYTTLPEDTAYGFLSRGCPNKCPWCVVPIKEGVAKPYWDIDRVANGRKNIVLMDNNILAMGDYCKEQLQKIIDRGYAVDFNQALDARLVTDDIARMLAKIKWIDRIRFGCDTHAQIKECERAMDLIHEYGYKGEFFLYTMIGGKGSTIEECYERIHYWFEKNQNHRKEKTGYGVYCHTQPFRDPLQVNEIPKWQMDMAQWSNKRMIWATCDFMDFMPRKNFICKNYFDQ